MFGFLTLFLMEVGGNEQRTSQKQSDLRVNREPEATQEPLGSGRGRIGGNLINLHGKNFDVFQIHDVVFFCAQCGLIYYCPLLQHKENHRLSLVSLIHVKGEMLRLSRMGSPESSARQPVAKFRF